MAEQKDIGCFSSLFLSSARFPLIRPRVASFFGILLCFHGSSDIDLLSLASFESETSFGFLSSARSLFFARYFLFLNFCLFWSRASFYSMCVSSGLMFCFLNDILHVSLGGLHVGLSSNIVFPFPLLSFFYIKCYMNFGPSSLLSALWIWYLANLLHRISVAIRVLWKGFWYTGAKTLNYTK